MAKPALPHVPSRFFAVRTPLMQFDEFLAWGAGLQGASASDATLERVLANDRQLLRSRLRAVLERSEVRESLFIASPNTHADLDKWVSAPDNEYPQKLERTLVRYFSRMTSRPTPFGLFSGCSVGVIGESTRLKLSERSHYKRHTRLDNDYLCKLSDSLATDPRVAPYVRYRPNSSLYEAAGRLRYAEARYADDVRHWDLVAVEANPLVDALLAHAAETPNGATKADLALALVALDPEISQDDAETFVGELAASQLLVADLAPCVTGPEPIHEIITKLEEDSATSPLAGELRHARDALAAIDQRGLGSDAGLYRDIAKRLESLPCPVELPRLFQVDMVKPAPNAALGTNVVEALRSTIRALQRIARPQRSDALEGFRSRFEARFERQEVPLMVALDDESGVGYGDTRETVSLLDGIKFARAKTASWTVDQRHTVLMSKLEEAREHGDREIVLREDDLKRMANPSPPALARSFSVVATLLAKSPDAIDPGNFRLVFKGTCAGLTLLGRFCHSDPELSEYVSNHLRAEDELTPDAVVAEIVHLPEGRIGNVINRPVLRDYEIVFLGKSGAPLERQITVDDLLVSVGENREIVLRSKRLRRQVIPRMTNAHNFNARSIGVYRFLCDLGRDGHPYLGLDWGPLEMASHRPRVRIDRTVVSLETWRIQASQLEPLAVVKGTARFRAVKQLRAKYRLPRFVALVDGDNVLPVDLDNVLSIESFVQLAKDRRAIVLEELDPDNLSVVEGPEGRFCHELVVPMLARDVAPSIEPGVCSRRSDDVVRAFPPGSEWLYAKLYTGNATADRVLAAVRPVIDDALAAGTVDSWFFIRYGDPDWHIRLRFHGTPARLAAEVLPALHAAAAPLLADGRMWKLQLDTYVREVERYGGGHGVEIAERWFAVDSRTTLDIIDLLDGDAGNDARWRLAFRGIDQLLDDLGFDFATKHGIVRRARDGFAHEHNATIETTRPIGHKFRQERAALEALLDRMADTGSELAPALALMTRASPRVRAIGEALRDAERAGRLTLRVTDIASSYMHMLVNRLLKSAARQQELVIYDFLERCYTSRSKRVRPGE